MSIGCDRGGVRFTTFRDADDEDGSAPFCGVE
jgi:hypothetical protein